MLIEKEIIEYLSAALDVPVYAKAPETKPDSYCLVFRAGGTSANHIAGASIQIQCYAPTQVEAAELDETVKTAMLTGADEIRFSAHLNSDADTTNTTTKQPRYTAGFWVYYNEEM